jgi:hypothetical protein
MPVRENFSVHVLLPDEEVTVPARPVAIPQGAYFVWPVNFTTEGVTLRYATAQLITTLSREKENYVFAVAQDGIAPEFAISLQPGQSVDGSMQVATSAWARVTIHPTPGTNIAFTVRSASGNPTHFVVLTQEQAERLTVVTIHGEKTLIYSGAYAFSDGEMVHLRSAGQPDVFFGILSASDGKWQGTIGLKSQPPEGVFQVYEAAMPARAVTVKITPTKSAGKAPPVKLANPAGWRKQPVAVAPTDATMQDDAAEWTISLPKNVLAGTENVFLQIHYRGDVARFYAGGALRDDNFYNGEPWVIGLKRFAGLLDAPLKLQILPLRQDAPVYFDAGYKPKFSGKQVVGVDSVTAIPEYEVVVHP